MQRLFISIFLGLIVIVGILFFQASDTTLTVYTPKTLYPDLISGKASKNLQIVGRVGSAPIVYETSPILKLSFSLGEPGVATPADQEIKVIYYGVKPDMFAAGRDLIIDGYIDQQTIVATKLMTQCPSKYEAPTPKS